MIIDGCETEKDDGGPYSAIRFESTQIFESMLHFYITPPPFALSPLDPKPEWTLFGEMDSSPLHSVVNTFMKARPKLEMVRIMSNNKAALGLEIQPD